MCMNSFNLWAYFSLGLFDLENHILTIKNMKLKPIDIAVYYVTGAENTYISVQIFNFKPIHAELMKKRQFESETQIECQKWVWQSHVQIIGIGTDTGKSSVAATNDYWGAKNGTERLAYKYLKPLFTQNTNLKMRGRSRIIKLLK